MPRKPGRPRKVHSFRESVESKLPQAEPGRMLASWRCRTCGNWHRRSVTAAGEVVACECGERYEISVVNTTVHVKRAEKVSA